MSKIYNELSIGIYENVAKNIQLVFENIEPVFKTNKKTVFDFIDRFIQGHFNVINKYGNNESLNKIFIEEISKYYNNAIGLTNEDLELYFSNAFEKEPLPYTGKEVAECAILYPGFIYKQNGLMLSHIPIVDIYILKDKEKIHINPGVLENINDSINFIESTTKEVAAIWTQNNQETKEEIEAVSLKIFESLVFENKAAYREQIMRELVQEYNQPDFLRFI